MPDTKITALTAISTVNPATYPLPIVDTADTTMAASGTTKKITVNQILGSGGTATLASATITGDLTVATSVLKVDTANTRVGINTTSINGGPFNVKISPAIDAKFVVQDGFTTGNVRLAAVDNAYSTYKVMDYSALSHAWYNSGSTAMTLNSTGLGVGVSPAYKLDIGGAGSQQFRIQMSGQADTRVISDTGAGIIGTYSNHQLIIRSNSITAITVDTSQNVGIGVLPGYKLDVNGTGKASSGWGVGDSSGNLSGTFINESDVSKSLTINADPGNAGANSLMQFKIDGSTRLTIDSTGNVGIGVAPSAWGSTYRALQIGLGTSLTGITNDVDVNLVNNARFDGTNWKYTNTSPAERYRTAVGTHFWFNAPSGTAGQTTTVTSGNSYTIAAAGGTNYTTFGAANNNVGTTFTATSSGTGNGGGVTQNIIFTQAMTLDASGRLLVGQTSTGLLNINGIDIEGGDSNGGSYIIVNHKLATASGQQYAFFGYNAVKTGDITQNGTTGVLYNTVSDYRLKESVQPLSNGLSRVSALKPSIYKWKSDGSSGEGFLAHELAEVVPFAVTGEKDAVNEDGSIKAQSVDMSRVIPILVAAIQELTARVQTLESK